MIAERDEPTTLNPFTRDPSGERLSEVRQGLFARSFTAPGQEGHWATQRSSVGVHDLALGQVARFEVGRRLEETCLSLSPDAANGEVVLVGIEGGIKAFRAADGAPLEGLACEGSEGLYFAVDEARRRVWRSAEGGLCWEAWPTTWA